MYVIRKSSSEKKANSDGCGTQTGYNPPSLRGLSNLQFQTNTVLVMIIEYPFKALLMLNINSKQPK